ncbi:hypothetical protein [Mixta calida]|uniref:hypothetical protein n=1 Tax=Mixta calida TaxID=665913 RepID=UPI00403B1B7A
MKELSKQDVEVVLAGKGLPGELLAGESLAKYFARLYLATKESRDEQLSQRDAQVAALQENLNSCLITVAKYSGPDNTGNIDNTAQQYEALAGWKMVPVEPTAEMYDAGDKQLATKQVWDAMLAAAPKPEGQ